MIRNDSISAERPGSKLDITRLDARDMFSDLALFATFAAVLGIFAVSPFALEMGGIHYLDSSGGILTKLHVATPLAFGAFTLRCLAAHRPIHTAWRLMTDDVGVLLLLTSVLVAALFAIVVEKSPVTPLVDTFVLPVLIFLLLRDFDRRFSTYLTMAVTVVLIANACLAFVELKQGFHLIKPPIPPGVGMDPTKANVAFSWQVSVAMDWRPEALLGHPLVNGLIVGSLLICLAAPGAAWIPLHFRLPLFVLQALALFSSGARTALVLTILSCGALALIQVAEAIARGARLSPRTMRTGLLSVSILAALVALVVATGMIDRTLDRFSSDAGSASARLTMLSLLHQLPYANLILYPDKDLVATLQRIYGLEIGIESSWIGLVLAYGLVVTLILVAGLLAFWRSILRVSGRGGLFVCLSYLLQVSITANLSGKSTTLAMVAALMLLFLRSDDHRARPSLLLHG